MINCYEAKVYSFNVKIHKCIVKKGPCPAIKRHKCLLIQGWHYWSYTSNLFCPKKKVSNTSTSSKKNPQKGNQEATLILRWQKHPEKTPVLSRGVFGSSKWRHELEGKIGCGFLAKLTAPTPSRKTYIKCCWPPDNFPNCKPSRMYSMGFPMGSPVSWLYIWNPPALCSWSSVVWVGWGSHDRRFSG